MLKDFGFFYKKQFELHITTNEESIYTLVSNSHLLLQNVEQFQRHEAFGKEIGLLKQKFSMPKFLEQTS
jgi:hypothetical protein